VRPTQHPTPNTTWWGCRSSCSSPEALADALIVQYDGALATANTAAPARVAAMTAKRIALLTLAAAKPSSSA
jgi:hypothetical protein